MKFGNVFVSYVLPIKLNTSTQIMTIEGSNLVFFKENVIFVKIIKIISHLSASLVLLNLCLSALGKKKLKEQW